MAYVITLTNGTHLTTVADTTIDTTTTMNLVGKDYAGYGGAIAENFVHLLENSANSAEPASPLVGQIFFNTNTQVIEVWNGSDWLTVGPVNNTLVDITLVNGSLTITNPACPTNRRTWKIFVSNTSPTIGMLVFEALNDDLSLRNLVMALDGVNDLITGAGGSLGTLTITTSLSMTNSELIVTNSSAPSGHRGYGVLVNTSGQLTINALNNDNSFNSTILTVDGPNNQIIADGATFDNATITDLTMPDGSLIITNSTAFSGEKNYQINVEVGGSSSLYFNCLNDDLTFQQTIMRLNHDDGLIYGVVAGYRIRMSGDLNFYVSTTGSDVATGLDISHPFLTIQHAWNNILFNYDLNGHICTINVADGTYTSGSLLFGQPVGFGVTGGVALIGNVGTPANCIINVATGVALNIANGAFITIKGFTLMGGGAITDYESIGTGLAVGASGVCIFDHIVFGVCTYAHIAIVNGGVISTGGNPYTISGSAPAHLSIGAGGAFTSADTTLTITGTPNFTSAFLEVTEAGTANVWNMTFIGSATGLRYATQTGGTINTLGAGTTYLPGDTPGVSTTGYYE